MYQIFKEYIVENSLIKNNKKMIFYPVTIEEINNSETRMKKRFPQSIKTFYLEIGWGYFEDESKSFINLFMSPDDIADFYCAEGNYVYAEEREFLKENEFVFFEVDANCHITLNFKNDVEEGIYFGTDKIADSFFEFINKMRENSNYYDDICQ